MMISSDGYSISVYPQKNKIIIQLPQTTSTLTSSPLPVVDRKDKLSLDELSAVLGLIKYLYQNRAPVFTNADKFREVFGMDPNNAYVPAFWCDEYQDPNPDKGEELLENYGVEYGIASRMPGNKEEEK